MIKDKLKEEKKELSHFFLKNKLMNKKGTDEFITLIDKQTNGKWLKSQFMKNLWKKMNTTREDNLIVLCTPKRCGKSYMNLMLQSRLDPSFDVVKYVDKKKNQMDSRKSP